MGKLCMIGIATSVILLLVAFVDADVSKCKLTSVNANCSGTNSPLPVPGLENTYRDIYFERNGLVALGDDSLKPYVDVEYLSLSYNKVNVFTLC